MVPRLSSIGRQAAEQALAAAFSAASSSLLPISAFAAASTSSTVGATAPGTTLAVGGTDQVDGFKYAGPDLAETRVFGQHRTRHGGADAETTLSGFFDCSHLGDFLDVDDQARPHRAGAHLHQKIGATSHDARGTPGGGKCADRFIQRTRA